MSKALRGPALQMSGIPPTQRETGVQRLRASLCLGRGLREEVRDEKRDGL